VLQDIKKFAHLVFTYFRTKHFAQIPGPNTLNIPFISNSYSDYTTTMTASNKDTLPQELASSRLTLDSPKPEVPSKISKPRLKIDLSCLNTNVPKAPHQEASPKSLEEEKIGSNDTLSRIDSPASANTLSAVANNSEKEVFQEDELYQAATILYRMAHSKQHRL